MATLDEEQNMIRRVGSEARAWDITNSKSGSGNSSRDPMSSNRNEVREIDLSEEIMNCAMSQLTDELGELTAEYREACRFVPELVERESNPIWFFSFHPSDPKAAATRLANYWKKRKEIFQERALLPITLTGQGALTAEDIRVLQTGYTINLPRDTKGRSVLYTDVSKKKPDMIPSQRVMFFFCQCVMENEMSRTDGFIFIRNISNPLAANFRQANHEVVKVLMATCMPIRVRNVHLLHIAPNTMPLFINTVFAWAVNFVGSYFGKASMLAHIYASKEDCLAHLLQFDFSPDGLPVALGGSWTGGCEPWRKGCVDGDELSLEIETDLSCLFRTVLWSHEQQQQGQQPSASAAAAPLPEIAPNNPHIAHNTATTMPLEPDCKMADSLAAAPNENENDNGSSSTNEKGRGRQLAVKRPRARAKSVDGAKRSPPSLGQRGTKSARSNNQTTTTVRRAKSLERSRITPDDNNNNNNNELLKSPLAILVAAAEQVVEEEEKRIQEEERKIRRRQLHTRADRIRRAKFKNEKERLQDQVLRLTNEKQFLEKEQQRLEGLVQAAMEATTTTTTEDIL